MMNREHAIRTINDCLDSLIKGNNLRFPLIEEEFPAEFIETVDKINRLNHEIMEMNGFLLQLTHGNLDADPSPRYNHLSGPAKEIHSQLTSLCINLEMLVEGRMVGQLSFPGKLYKLYNELIDKVSEILGRNGGDYENGNIWGVGITSWRYHQILGAVNQLSIMVLEVAVDGRIVFANPLAQEVLSDRSRLPYGEESLCDDVLMGYLCTFQSSQLDDGLTEFPVLYELHDYTGGVWYKIRTDRVKISDGTIGLLHVIDDISEWKHNEIKLRQKTMIDPLTGAYNRLAGLQKLDEMMRARFHSRSCVAFADLDGLKKINDEYGHTEGDKALKLAVDILKKCVRDTDWVVRYGGDEFLIYFLDCSRESAEKIIERMYRCLDELNRSDDRPFAVSFSVGLGELTKEVADIDEFVSIIDEKMYINKRKRKGLE